MPHCLHHYNAPQASADASPSSHPILSLCSPCSPRQSFFHREKTPHYSRNKHALKRLQTFSATCIPHLHRIVIRPRRDLSSIRRKRYAMHTSCMPLQRPQIFSCRRIPICIVLSLEPDTIFLPSGEKDTLSICEYNKCPYNVCRHSPLVTSHTFTVLSYDPDATRPIWRKRHTLYFTRMLQRTKFLPTRHVPKFHRAFSPEAIIVPSGENDTLFTPVECSGVPDTPPRHIPHFHRMVI